MAEEIHKQQLIVEKLNFLTDEKQKRIAEIEGLFEIKAQRSAKEFDMVSSERAPDLATSYFIS